MSGGYRTPHECEEIFTAIDPEKVRAAAAHLRSWLPEPDRQRLSKIIREHGHYGWIFHLHDEEVAAEPRHRSKAVIAAKDIFNSPRLFAMNFAAPASAKGSWGFRTSTMSICLSSRRR